MEFWIFSCLFLIISAFGAGAIATTKDRSFGQWFLLGLLIGPIAILIVGFMAPQEKVISGQTKKCPYCAEIIKDEAVVCRFCGNDLPTFESITEELKDITENKKSIPSKINKDENDKWKTVFGGIGWQEEIGRNTQKALTKSNMHFLSNDETILFVTYADIKGTHITGLKFNEVDLSSPFAALIASNIRLILIHPNERIVKAINYEDITEVKSSKETKQKTYYISTGKDDEAIVEILIRDKEDENIIDMYFERITLLP